METLQGRNLSCTKRQRRVHGKPRMTHRQWSDSYPIHERYEKQKRKIEYRESHGVR